MEVFQYNQGGQKMETLTIDSGKLKELLKEAIIEAMEEKKDLVHDLLVEAMEDLAMIHAIQQGEETETVSREEVFNILEGNA
jgi:hypothetical protein